jgi:hypothetical protein
LEREHLVHPYTGALGQPIHFESRKRDIISAARRFHHDTPVIDSWQWVHSHITSVGAFYLSFGYDMRSTIRRQISKRKLAVLTRVFGFTHPTAVFAHFVVVAGARMTVNTTTIGGL